jgi:hypothetical protein
MEIGPVLLTQGHTHARDAHVTDVQYYGRRALSTKSVVAGDAARRRTHDRAGDERAGPVVVSPVDVRGQAGRTLLIASDMTLAAPWQNVTCWVPAEKPRPLR